MNVNLLEFDLEDIPENPSICLCGKRRAGKGILTRDLVYNYFRGKVKNCFLFSPTAEIAVNGFDFVPMEFRYDEMDIDVIERIIKRQKYLIQNNPKGDYRIMLIFDDLIGSTDAKQQKILDKLFICARHFQITLIVCYQYMKQEFTPKQRENVDVIFCFQQSNFDNKDALNRQYLSVSDDKKQGIDLINKYAIGYQSIVILNTKNSSDYEDFCFYYEADIIEKKFKLGKDYEE